MLNVTRDTGEFLAVLVRAIGARQVLEIGTSNGYSTLWLAEAVRARKSRTITLRTNGTQTEFCERRAQTPCLSRLLRLVKKSFGLKSLGNWQGCADLFVEPLDEIRGECG